MLNTSIDDNGNSTALTISSDENLGIGTTTVTNNGLGTATYFGNSTSAITGDNTSGNSRFWLTNNWKYDSGDKYIITDEATLYTQQNGKHIFSFAPSGSANSAITFSTGLEIDNAGHVTKPLQSGFNAEFSSNSDVDLTTTGYTNIPFNAERWDTNGDYNTSTYTFTAPVTGKYLFNFSMGFNSMDNASAWFAISFQTSNHSYHHWIPPNDLFTGGDLNGNFTMKTSAVADMDANDTCYARVYLYNGTPSQFTYLGDNRISFFTGYLLG